MSVRARAQTRWLLFAVLALSGCGQMRHGGDIDEMRRSGELRVVVRPGFSAQQRTRAVKPDEERLIRDLAVRIGVKVRFIEAPRNDLVLLSVRNGNADLGIARFAPDALLADDLRSTAAIDWVEDLLVASPGAGPIDLGGIRGQTLHLRRSDMTARVAAFQQRHGLIFEPIAEEVSCEEILRRVIGGRYPLSIIDSGIVHAERALEPPRVLGPIAERRALVWAVRSSSPRLRMATDDFLFAEQVLRRGTRTRTCRDLELVQQAGVLRLVTRNSPTTCTVARGGIGGFEYDLAQMFARELRVRLELAIPPPEVDPLVWLERGYGDIAALHEPVAPIDAGQYLVTAPYRRVDLVSVVSKRGDLPTTVEDLAGLRVLAARPTSSLVRLVPLRPPIRALPPEPAGDAFTAMHDVVRGRAQVAVVDRDAARLELRERPDLQEGAVVLPDVGLVWILNPSATSLHRAADRFLAAAERSGKIRQLAYSRLGSWQPSVAPDLPPIPDSALTPYDEVLKWVGRQYGIDWRLLASLMYEESRFDPDAIGPGGSAGLFQFMPSTWRELGVEDPHHPAEAAEAAGRYLQRLMEEFGNLPLPDRVAMSIASFNVGPRHVFDARRLASQMGFDPDVWSGSVETALVILDDPEVARRFPAGVCRCRRAANYTRRILRRYQAYAEQFPPA